MRRSSLIVDSSSKRWGTTVAPTRVTIKLIIYSVICVASLIVAVHADEGEEEVEEELDVVQLASVEHGELQAYRTRLNELLEAVDDELLTRRYKREASDEEGVEDEEEDDDLVVEDEEDQLRIEILSATNDTLYDDDSWSMEGSNTTNSTTEFVIERVHNYTLPPLPPLTLQSAPTRRPRNGTSEGTRRTTLKRLGVTMTQVSEWASNATRAFSASTTTTTTTTGIPIVTKTAVVVTESTAVPSSTTTSTHAFTRTFVQRSTTMDPCVEYDDEQLIRDLKTRGTYNPELMAYNVEGVLQFLRKHYLHESRAYAVERSSARTRQEEQETVKTNLFALEHLLSDLKVNCNVRSSETIAELYKLTYGDDRTRLRLLNSTANNERHLQLQRDYAKFIYRLNRDIPLNDDERRSKSTTAAPVDENGVIGTIHKPTNLCAMRGTEEMGYLRLCSACDAIRTLPDNYFPRQLFETICDEDHKCLTVEGMTMGKCRQRQLLFKILRNVGTARCQKWIMVEMPVRVSCECFVKQSTFLAPYV